ncbi:MAG: hypothetical protein RLY49_411 [Candidatus Parcubacteria bacterium]|jgi:hypothetical protein
MKRGFLKTFIVLGFLVVFLFNTKTIFAQNIEEYPSVAVSNQQNQQEDTIKTAEPGELSFGWYWDPQKGTWQNLIDNGWNNVPAVNVAAWAMGTTTSGVGTPALSCTLNPLACIVSTGAWFSVQIFSLILYLSGGIFDFIIQQTVLSQTLINNLESSILVAWKIVRDLSNIIIVFSLLYLGIKTIIDGQGFADKKTLISVIIVAILINFSLVFTRAVFDVSNLIGAQIGEQIKFNDQTSTQSGITSISAGLVKMIRPASNMNFISDPSKDGWGQLWDKVQVAIFTNITIIAVSVILLGSCFLLLYRFLIFIVLMISSPFGLVAKFLPWFKGMGDSWWKMLKTQAIVLPAFLLTLYVSILFVGKLSSQFAVGTVSFNLSGGTLEQVANNLVLFCINFLLIIGFLILPLIVPGKIGAAGAGIMTSAGNWTMNKVRTMPQIAARGAASTTARSGRYLVGDKLATSIGGSTKEKKEALQQRARGNGLDAFIARQRLKQSESLKDKTYDVRNINAVKNSKFGKEMGGSIESYNAVIKRKQGEYEERKKKEMKMYGYDKLHESTDNQVAIVKAEKALQDREVELKTRRDTLESAKKNPATTDAQLKTYLSAVKTAEKLVEVEEKKVGEFKNIGAVQHLEHDSKQFLNRVDRFFSNTSRKTLEKIKEENKKKWITAGESKSKRQKKASAKKLDKDLADDVPAGDSGKK